MNIIKTNNDYYLRIGRYIEQKYSKLNCQGLYGVKIATFLDIIAYWSKTNGNLKKFRHHGKNDWCFYTYKQFRNDLGCGIKRASNIIQMCVDAGVIECCCFGINNKMHFRIVPKRLLELAQECKVEKKIIAQIECGFELDVALPDWLSNDIELFCAILHQRKQAGLPAHKLIQLNLIKDLERIKNASIDGTSIALNALKYAVLKGNHWVIKIAKPAFDTLDFLLAKVKKILLKEVGGLTESIDIACEKAKESIKRRDRRQIKKCPNLALGHL